MTNLDKFYDIEVMMDEAETYMDSYLDVLRERHDYMSEYRAEFRKLKRATYEVLSALEQTEADTEEVNALMKSARNTVGRLIEQIEADIEADADNDYERLRNDLQEALEYLTGKTNRSGLEDAQIILSKYDINIPELDILLEDFRADINMHSDSLTDRVIGLINQADDEYLSGFREYRYACEQDDGVYEAFDDIISILMELDLDDEAETIAEVLPDIEEERKARPDPEPLLDILVPIKSAGLEYYASNYNKSESYALNRKFASEIAYTRRALLEDREYKGTESAFNRLRQAYEDLHEYMYERFHQLGGTPNNYHGHENR